MHDLRNRITELTAQEQRLLERLQQLRAQQDHERALLQQEAEREQASPDARKNVSVERVRDIVVRLGQFTMSELASELECSPPKAKAHLQRMSLALPGAVRQAGRLGRSPLYEYVAPTEPGKAFEAQQRLAPRAPVELFSSTTGGEVVSAVSLSSVTPKELRPVVREAIANGWTLTQTSGKHKLRLVRGTQTIGLPSTPRNAGDAANILRRQLHKADTAVHAA